jgi:hypothetical protein
LIADPVLVSQQAKRDAALARSHRAAE